MFTGIIEQVGRMEALVRRGPDARLRIRTAFEPGGLKLGDSVAVSGACLTVASLGDSFFEADVSAETLSRTTLGRLKPGSAVNLERALRLGDRLGGHLVSGHVDGLGLIAAREPVGESLRLRLQAGAEVIKYLIPKGSVAVDGISLTVNALGPDWFEVNIIAHTAGQTTLGLKGAGEAVNIETDLIGKYVARLMGPWRPGQDKISPEFLAEHGFLT